MNKNSKLLILFSFGFFKTTIHSMQHPDMQHSYQKIGDFPQLVQSNFETLQFDMSNPEKPAPTWQEICVRHNNLIRQLQDQRVQEKQPYFALNEYSLALNSLSYLYRKDIPIIIEKRSNQQDNDL